MHGGKAYKWIRNPLAVIACAAVVIWVAAFAIQRAREVAEQQQCAENLKHLSEACQMYQADWHDVLVPYGAPFAWDSNGMWPCLLAPYLKRLFGSADGSGPIGRVFVCPGFPPEERCFCGQGDYGINPQCGGWMPKGKPVVMPLKSVKYPTSTIRLAESRWHAQGGSLFAARPSDFKPNDPTGHMFATWHIGKGNVLWIDGHVSAMTQKQYNMRDKGPYDGNIWLRLEGPKPAP